MADRCDGLSLIKETLHEGDDIRQQSKRIGIKHPAGQGRRIEVIGVRISDWHVDSKLTIPIGKILSYERDGTSETRSLFRPSLVKRLAPLSELNSFETARHIDHDLSVFQRRLTHDLHLWRLFDLSFG
jgi:hypothetical protein